MEIKICDLGIVIIHIKDTYNNYIFPSQTIKQEKKLEYGLIILILSIFKQIISNKNYLFRQDLELQLKDKILLKNEKIIGLIFN